MWPFVRLTLITGFALLLIVFAGASAIFPEETWYEILHYLNPALDQ